MCRRWSVGSGDGETLAKDNRYRRGGSYQSLLSDGEYADAEEEWEHEEGEEAIHVTDPQDASTPLPPVSFAEVDQYFGVDNVRPGYDILKKRYDSGDKSSTVLWRLARFCHELACHTTDKGKKKDLIFEGKKYALEGHHTDENDFEAVKWAAIMTGQSTDYVGTKERIEEGGKFKELLDKALTFDSKDFALLHLRGRYAHSVASLSWIERKAAAVFYSTPPTATIEEALEDFLAAYEIKPDWIENLLYIARIYYAKGDKANAKKFLSKLLSLKPNDESEREMQEEAKKLLSKC
uniref:TPR_REGION domain-containing protein n=1 Tax=Haemonchus contortus TaxID=6289 RepID=A0A7I4YSQ4_HAECO